MSKRVTVMIADDLDKKIRTKQAYEIKKTLHSVGSSSNVQVNPRRSSQEILGEFGKRFDTTFTGSFLT